MNLDIKNFQLNLIKIQPLDFDELQNTIHSTNCDDNQDIIILDDDDFIQTTLNLLDKTGNSLLNDSSHQMQMLDSNSLNPKCTESIADDENNNTLIDLTSDFDLNDLFQMHANNNNNIGCTQFSEVGEEKSTDCQQIIKNEFDFKVKNKRIASNCKSESNMEVKLKFPDC